MNSIQNLLPAPKQHVASGPEFPFPGIRLESNAWPNESPVITALSSLPSVDGGTPLRLIQTNDLAPQAYTLKLAPTAITIESSAPQGAFYALKTLEQLSSSPIATLLQATITDEPDYENRGYYYDISRGKVPTLDTLKTLADDLAANKINQLQLYMEHTFAFKSFPSIWEGADPLTGHEIEELDAYCKDRYIELVPSLSTFGHFCVPLTKKRFEHLNELEINASEHPFSWMDHMRHHTLDCQNPESIAMVKQMIDDIVPHFSSDKFNICCDETFDLGTGRNKDLADKVGKSKLYIDFLKQVMAIVEGYGRTPMFWGDIVTHHPELTGEIPKSSICLDWDYSATLTSSKCERFEETGIPFYICPGIQSWNTFLLFPDLAIQNISRFATKGKRHGAAGILTTDWGDKGHPAHFSDTRLGIRIAGALSWNNTLEPDLHPEQSQALLLAAALQVYGDQAQDLVALMLFAESNKQVTWHHLALWIDRSYFIPDDWRMDYQGLPAHLSDTSPAAVSDFAIELQQKLSQLPKPDTSEQREVHHALKSVVLLHEAFALSLARARDEEPDFGYAASDVADAIRIHENEFSSLWHARNKPSEYFRIRLALLEIAHKLDSQ